MSKKKNSAADEAIAEATSSAESETPAEETQLEAQDEATQLDEDAIADLMADGPDDDEVAEEAASSEEGSEQPEAEAEAEAPLAEAESTEEEAPAKEEEPKTEEEAEAAPAAEQKPKEEEAPTPEPEAEAAPQKTAEELAEEQRKWREETETKLADEYFRLTDEQLEGLDFTPEQGQVLSKMASKLLLDSTQAAVTTIVQQLPHIIRAQQTQERANADLETKFFEAWPKLNMKEHRDTLYLMGTAYRTAHPKATEADFIKHVGAQVMVAEGVAFEVETPAPAADEVQRETTRPHAPLNGSPGSSKPKPTNQFTQFTDEILNEELNE